MGVRVGMLSRQGVMLFALGVLAGALLLGGGAVSLSGIGDDAQAQNVNTWQMETFRYCEYTGTGNPPSDFYTGCSPQTQVSVPDFLATLPSSCTVEPLLLAGGEQIVFLYAC